MSAGRRNQLVTLQRYTASQDQYGEEVQQVWANLGTEWVAVFYGRGDERRQAAMEQGSQAATFQMLSNETTRALTIRDRIVLGSDNWDVVSLVAPRRGEIEVTAVRAV